MLNKEPIWRFFTPNLTLTPNIEGIFSQSELSYAFCNECNELCKTTGPGNVHLSAHLKQQHWELWREYAKLSDISNPKTICKEKGSTKFKREHNDCDNDINYEKEPKESPIRGNRGREENEDSNDLESVLKQSTNLRWNGKRQRNLRN